MEKKLVESRNWQSSGKYLNTKINGPNDVMRELLIQQLKTNHIFSKYVHLQKFARIMMELHHVVIHQQSIP